MEIIYATPFQLVIAMMWAVISCLAGRRSHQGLAIMVRNSSDIVPEVLFLGRPFPELPAILPNDRQMMIFVQ